MVHTYGSKTSSSGSWNEIMLTKKQDKKVRWVSNYIKKMGGPFQ